MFAWLRKFIHAMGVGFGPFVTRHPWTTLGVVIWGTIMLLVAIPRWMETPEQTRAREAAEAQSADKRYTEEKADHEKKQLLCKMKSICRRYGQARQECATAGSFKHCIGVKMNDDDYEDIVGGCTADGHLLDASSEPGALDCWGSQ